MIRGFELVTCYSSNNTRQPMPVERLAWCWEPAAGRGCAERSAGPDVWCFMKAWNQLATCFLLCSLTIHAAERRPLLEVAPTVAELGEGWKAHRMIFLIDPLSQPSEIGSEDLLKTMSKMMADTGREAYLGMAIGHRAMTNHECRVNIQRWPSAEALTNHHYRKDPLPGKAPPRIGQEAYWTGGEFVSGLAYRLDQYLVVIEGWASDDARILRLAKVIEAKLAGKPIPKDAVDDRQ